MRPIYRTPAPVAVATACYLASVPTSPAPPRAIAVPTARAVGPLGALWRGALMGAADVVPGVSGGTMALVLGVYARLLTALAAITRPPVWQALRARRWRLAWRSVDGTFLLGLVGGIAFSVIALAGVVEAALAAFRPQVYALFLGLIAASIVVVAREVGRWRPAEALSLLVAAVVATVLVSLAPISTPSNVPFLVLTGAIGICALVLPGVSGAFLLVLLGQYETVLGAIARGDLRVLAPFALGAGVGLLAFARLLGGWLRRFPDPTHAALAGFLLGSLRRVWPWQVEDALRLTPIAPPTAGAVLVALLLALLGAGAVLALTRLGRLRRV
jgi:putative membrane protein